MTAPDPPWLGLELTRDERAELKRDAVRGWGQRPVYPRVLAALRDIERLLLAINQRPAPRP